MPEPDSDRLASLERRVAALEEALSTAPRGEWSARAASSRQRDARSEHAGARVAANEAAVAASVPEPAPRAAAKPGGRGSLADLEERLSGRVLASAGGIALVVGGLFFLSLAFNRGWIGPEARVVIGLVAAAAALGIGAWLFERGYGQPALVLVAVGVAVGMLALYAATQLYGFIPAPAGLLATLVIAAGAAAISIRADSQAVAALGLLAALAAPPILAADADLVAVAYLGTCLAGTTAIAVWRSWGWLPLLAFVVSAPQVGGWLGDGPGVELALVVVTIYWAVNTIAAGGSALVHRRWALHRGAASVVVLSALFTIAALRSVLGDEDAAVRTAALLALAALYAALATPFVMRTQGRHPFGVLAAGAAVGTLIITIALELGGAYQPIAWAALATGLAWSAVRLRHRWAAAGAAVSGWLALAHLFALEYPVRVVGRIPAPEGVPFASPEGIVLAVLVIAILAITAVVAADPVARGKIDAALTAQVTVALGAAATAGLVAYAAPFELVASEAIVLWAGLAAGLFALAVPLQVDRRGITVVFGAGVALVAVGVGVVLDVLAPPDRLSVDVSAIAPTVTPLVNPESGAMLALALALVVAALAAPSRTWASSAGAGAAGLIVYLGSVALVDAFQARVAASTGPDVAFQAQVALSIAWVLAGAAAFTFGLARRSSVARLFGLGLLAVATGKVFLVDLSALDVAYRVLSFIGLGLVLLATSFLSIRSRRTSTADAPGTANGPAETRA